ncbi:hypothetical protein GE09DRAFT_1123928 [Coniochaeta sp. 2T2.1]|nr:hypothetical protein GE09DRAFT_1123928 [Coniochaeta sp. 2T2.1]
MALQEPSPGSSTTSIPLEKKDEITSVIHSAIDTQHDEISSLNRQIYSNPELAYEEHKAHDAFVTHLRFLNFEVTPKAYGLETSFMAEYGSGGRLVIYNAEYDALPGIGHACGHNLIASAAFSAFLGLAAALKKSGKPGRVRLLGTPAEEGGGGKLKLLEAGAYKDCDASLMVHPGPDHKLPAPLRGVAFVRMLANVKMKAFFTGKEAHAAIAPWDGVNALDAVCLSYNAISMLRQQIKPFERVHGVFRSAGERPNVTPAHTCVEYYCRSDTRANAERLWKRVEKCFEGAAIATGCEVRTEPLNSYADVRSSGPLCRAYVEAMPAGTVLYDETIGFLAGSTDMGNVTYACPGFHGAFGIESKDGASNHTKGFTAVAGTQDALERAIECGKGMAVVGWRMLTDDAFAAETKKAWEEDMIEAAK